MFKVKNITIQFKSKYLAITVLIIVAIVNITNISCYAQSFNVNKESFNSSSADDFAPMFYKNGLVYCSNGIKPSLLSIKSENEALFNLVYVESKDSGNWKTPVLFSEELTTILNEGPATFTSDLSRIYYARNIQTDGKLRKINDPSNTLGIYSADFIQGNWSNISGFEFNSDSYSVGTPALSPDGQRLYFASDRPGSYGGTDIYYCDWISNTWSEPVNLGSEINSEYNESYPYIDESGRLFFASDKPGGFGGKDIYYSLEYNGEWISPIHLDEDINSSKDDFGLITDKNFEWGYFSSDRKSGMNIYSFETQVPQFDICENDSAFYFCYDFYDERFTDTLHLEYEWDFGHGEKLYGMRVKKCFEKPGSYTTVLTITHHLADCTFHTKFDYNFEIVTNENTIIYPEKNIILEQPANFLAVKETDPKTYNEYYWNFGEGYNITGKEVRHVFNETGEHIVSLGIVSKDENLNTISKQCHQTKVMIYSDCQHLASKKFTRIPALSQASSDKDYYKNTEHYMINNFILADLPPRISDSLTSLFTTFPNYLLLTDKEGNLTNQSKKLLENYAHILSEFPDIILTIAIHQNQIGRIKNTSHEIRQTKENIEIFFELQRILSDVVRCISYGTDRPLINSENNKTSAYHKRIEFILSNRF